MSKLHLTKGSEKPTFPEDGKLRLYSMRFCPYAQRAHLVLEAKNIPYHTAYIHLQQKPEWLTEVSPLGRVPALEIPSVNGDPLIESLVIADYLDEQYPENPLSSNDPLQRARDKIMIERFNGFIGPFFYKIFYPPAGTEISDEALADVLKALDIFEDELKKRGTKFFGGEKPGFLDYMIWPFIERIEAFPFILNNGFEFDKTRFGNFVAWKEEMKQDKAVKAVSISGENNFNFRNSYLEDRENPNYNILL